MYHLCTFVVVSLEFIFSILAENAVQDGSLRSTFVCCHLEDFHNIVTFNNKPFYGWPPLCSYVLSLCFSFGLLFCNINQYMRSTHGNTSCQLRFTFLNPDGVSGRTRAAALTSLNSDIICLSETHLTSELQTLAQNSFTGYQAYWGAPAHGKGGVGFLVKKGSVWHTRPLSWNSDSACLRHYEAGRLHGITLHVGNGKQQVLCYVMYGQSGARWNLAMRAQTHQMIEHVLADATERGLPCILGGDINLQISDSHVLQRMQQMGWHSLALAFGKNQQHTSFKGSGSIIDHVYSNSLAFSFCKNFEIGDRTGLADHAPLHADFLLGPVAQRILRNRDYGKLPVFPQEFMPNRPSVAMDTRFGTALQDQNVELALRLWNNYAEQHLKDLVFQFDNSISFKQGRGVVRLDSTHQLPHIRGDRVAPLLIRRLWKNVCRMSEVASRPYGVTAQRAWQNTFDSLCFLPSDLAAEAQSLLEQNISTENATILRRLFERGISQEEHRLKQKRLNEWKSKLQASVKSQHNWIKNSTVSNDSFCFNGVDNRPTADIDEQFASVRLAWKAITELFKDTEPNQESFFREFGQFIPHKSFDLPSLTADMLRKELRSMPISCPGLDAWRIEDLKTLERFCPWIFDRLVLILQLIETTGSWPTSTISGFTTLIPKGDSLPTGPAELRPVTVLSTLYRLWARIRVKQVSKAWESIWHPGIWGGRPGRGPEPLLYELCLDMETSADQLFGGLSFDLSKAFDRVPRELLSAVLLRMGLPASVHTPYLSMLRHATRRYKLGNALDISQHLYGGILQGCPISMVAMNSIVNIWLNSLNSVDTAVKPRAYVDDVSVATTARDVLALRQQVTQIFQASRKFTDCIGGELNTRKSFSFGNSVLAGSIHPDLSHSNEFRLVGGSIVYRNSDSGSMTQLEIQRMRKWLATIHRCRHIPVSWQERCAILLRTRTQYTWGGGTHKLCTTKTHEAEITKLRSGIMRCLLRRDQYNANPSLYLALLTSPSLNPFFARIMDGLLTAWRSLWATDRFSAVKNVFYNEFATLRDGPISRLRQINSMPGFEHSVDIMFRTPLEQKTLWLHTLRDNWRQHEFSRVARIRPDFQGIQHGLLRDTTLQLLRHLEKSGACSVGQEATVIQEQARMQASVLRLLLTGGLMTQDVSSRHKRGETTNCDCEIGGPCSVMHIHWFCTHYASLRNSIRHLLRDIERAQPCFKYATLVTHRDRNLIPHVQEIQRVLIQIWQQQIRTYLTGDIPSGQQTDQNPVASFPPQIENGQATGIEEKGHYILSLEGGGVWCCKCGVFVRLAKHRRLKISNKICPQRSLDRTLWLRKPCYYDNPHRLMDLYKTYWDATGEHDLAWDGSANRSSGETGFLLCLKCGIRFAWKSRYNVKKQPCKHPKAPRNSTPPRWVSTRLCKEDPALALQRIVDANNGAGQIGNNHSSIPLSDSTQTVSRRRRLIGKQTVSRPQPSTAHEQLSTSSSSSSHLPPSHALFAEPARETTGFFLHYDDMG